MADRMLVKSDLDALQQVNIIVPGKGGKFEDVTETPTESGVILNGNTLQFPPIITKDSKQSDWKEVASGSYEPMKFYVQSKARAISLQFQWVCGGQFPPSRVHQIVSAIKSYFYSPFFAGLTTPGTYPAVKITKFYNLIQGDTTWRMMNVDVKYSKEMCQVGGQFYPLHVVVSMNLESATKLGRSGEQNNNEDSKAPFQNFTNLETEVKFEWM